MAEGDSDLPEIQDGREKWDWKSRYPGAARVHIYCEAFSVAVLFLGAPTLFIVWFAYGDGWLSELGFGADAAKFATVSLCAALGGLFGGSTLGMKWIYHSVAKGIWHQDRRLWRLLSPFISSGVSFGLITLARSGLMPIFDRPALERPDMVFALGFLAGLFCDKAVAKLQEIADSVFGTRPAAKRK